MAIENENELSGQEMDKWPSRGFAEELAACGALNLAYEMELEEMRELLLGRLGRMIDGLREVPGGVLGLYETIGQALNEITRLRHEAFQLAMDASWDLVGLAPEEEWEAFLASRDAYAYPPEGTYPIKNPPSPFHEQVWREWREARANAPRQPSEH